MRFRLGINATGSQPDTGFGRGFAALASLPLLQAQAADEASKAQAEGDLRAAQQRQADAHAALFQQQANEKRTQLERGGLGELLKNAALQNGVPLSQVDEASNYLQSGQLAGKYELPVGQAGPTLPKPQYADPGVGARIFNTLGLTRQALALGDQNIEHLAKAGGEYQKQDDVRRLQADPSAAGRTGQAYAAVEGKKLIDNIGNSGRGYNVFTGEAGTMEPGMAVLFDQGERAQINQRNAAAGASNASAEHSRASTRKVNQEIDQGQRTGNLQVVTGPDGTVTVVDKVNRTAQPVLGADGKPIVKGAAGGGGKPMTDSQAKANLFGGRMMESNALLSQLEDEGVMNTGIVKGMVQGTAGMLPLVGDKLSEAAGSAMNVLPGVVGGPSGKQQQVEQARRDFVNAVLRRESGAVISPSEFANAEKQYFPQPGDSKEVLAQKRRNRQIATTLMLQEVPEAQRYRLGTGYSGAPAPTAPQSGGASGGWGAPAAPAGWSIQRVN